MPPERAEERATNRWFRGWGQISDSLMARARRKRSAGHASPEHPFFTPEPPPGVIPKAVKPVIAQDEQVKQTYAWASQMWTTGAFAEGVTWLGYAYLSELAQRAEYRVISEVIATEMTREWITIKAGSGESKVDRVAELETAIGDFGLREVCRKLVVHDGWFGRGHVYIDTGDTEDKDELKNTIGDGRDEISKNKVGKGDIAAFRNVEPVWAYPTRYESSNPLKADWYRPNTWYVMSTEIHRSRFLTVVGREVPDLLKPAYAFGGLSMSQMAKPYVDNWLRTRQSVSDLVKSFSIHILKTVASVLTGLGGEQLFKRIDLFNLLRDNHGVMVVDKESEDWSNVQTSLGGLDHLQAQAQEHLASVSRIPIVKLLGIQPSGLNASSEGEIRSFYDWIAAFQEHLLRSPLQTMIDFTMLHLWGEVDKDITFDFVDLWQLDQVAQAALDKTKADTDDAYVAIGAVAPEEVRERLAKDKDSPYSGLDLSGPGPGIPGEGEGGEGGLEPPHDPGSTHTPATSVASVSAGGGGFDAFEEKSHPRGEGGQFVAAPGSQEIPKGSIRRFHVARPEHVESIRQGGLKPSGSPKKVYSWNNYEDAHNYSGNTNTIVEFHHDPKYYEGDEGHAWNSGGKSWSKDDYIPPENIVAIHEPWHQLYHQAKQAGTPPERLRRAGLPEYDRAAEQLERDSRSSGGAADQEDNRYSKAEVHYEEPAKNPANSCARCQHFKAPDDCELVFGYISPQGWCEVFEATEAKAT